MRSTRTGRTTTRRVHSLRASGTAVNANQRDDAHHDQHELERHQDRLDAFTNHDAAIRDVGHDRNEHNPEAYLDDRVLGEILQTKKRRAQMAAISATLAKR
jgi:hypothetical protein